MKWFKVDTNTPDDPKIQAVIRELGNAGLGMLFRLWCYIGAHGTRAPGLSCDSKGRKIDRSVLVGATGGNETEFDALMRVLSRERHISQKKWNSRGIIFIPAMSKRADTYTGRRVRTHFVHDAKFVQEEEKRIEEKSIYTGAHAPERTDAHASGNGHRPKKRQLDRQYWTVYRIATTVLGEIPIRQKIDPVSLKEDIKRACARKGVTYEGNVVGRAFDAAMVVRTKARTQVAAGAKR